MRYHELILPETTLTEASDAPLYHATSFQNAREILNSGILRGDGLLASDDDEEDFFEPISMTRDPFYRFMDHPVQFMFSGRILSQRFRIQPYNWFSDSPSSGIEAEESVWTRKGVPITLATAMILLPSEKKQPKNIAKVFHHQGDELAEIARSKGIEVVDWRERKLPVRPTTRVKNAHSIITEASDAPLYHATSFKGAESILDDGLLKGSIIQNAFSDDIEIQAISMSRDPHFHYMENPIQFMFDGRKLGQRFRITPFDWFGGRPRGFGKRREEREERVYAHKGIPINMATALILMPLKDSLKTVGDGMWLRRGDSLANQAKALGLQVIDLRGEDAPKHPISRRAVFERQQSPTLAFHGTSSKFLQSILSKGLIPEPPERVYSDGDFKAYEGVYFSDTFTVAAYRGYDAAMRFGGNVIVVCANLDQVELAGDEDSMQHFLWAIEDYIDEYITDNDLDENDNVDRMEAAAYAFRNYFGVEAPREFFRLVDDVPELSAEYRRIVDRLMRYIGPTRSGGNPAANDFRSITGARPEDIVCVVELRNMHEPDPTYMGEVDMRVIYGKLPKSLRSL